MNVLDMIKKCWVTNPAYRCTAQDMLEVLEIASEWSKNELKQQ